MIQCCWYVLQFQGILLFFPVCCPSCTPQPWRVIYSIQEPMVYKDFEVGCRFVVRSWRDTQVSDKGYGKLVTCAHRFPAEYSFWIQELGIPLVAAIKTLYFMIIILVIIMENAKFSMRKNWLSFPTSKIPPLWVVYVLRFYQRRLILFCNFYFNFY